MSTTGRYMEKLDAIAPKHIHPHAAQVVDRRVQTLDMRKMLPWVKGPQVLEMGYGDGMWTSEIVDRFGHTHIVDGSSVLLDHVRELHGEKQVTVFHNLFEEFTPPPGLRFDTIVATHVLEHVDEPVAILRRAHGWLNSGGRILIIVPNATSLHRQLAVIMGIQETVHDFSPRDHEVGHQRVYDLGMLRKDVAEAGYRVLLERGLFLKTLPNGMMVDFSDSLLAAMVDISDGLPTEWMANLAMVIEPMAH